MVINYYQPRNTSRDGVLVLDGQIFRTTGRLDAVGSHVFAWCFVRTHDHLRMAVQCERTSEAVLAASITVFDREGSIVASRRVPGIPLVVT